MANLKKKLTRFKVHVLTVIGTNEYVSPNYDDKNLDYLFLLENTWFCQLIFLFNQWFQLRTSVFYNIWNQFIFHYPFDPLLSVLSVWVILLSLLLLFIHVHLLNVNYCVLAIIGKYFFLARIRAVTTVPTLPFVYCPIKRLIDRQSKTTFTRSLLSINK